MSAVQLLRERGLRFVGGPSLNVYNHEALRLLMEDGLERLNARRDTFLVENMGIRCVSDRPWITAAETCECLLAYLSLGERDFARTLFGWAQLLRNEDGEYWTGIVIPEMVHFPGCEKSSYTAASIVLAADALSGTSSASGLFVDHDLLPEKALVEAEDLIAEDPVSDNRHD